jgi:hypothetical protein
MASLELPKEGIEATSTVSKYPPSPLLSLDMIMDGTSMTRGVCPMAGVASEAPLPEDSDMPVLE